MKFNAANTQFTIYAIFHYEYTTMIQYLSQEPERCLSIAANETLKNTIADIKIICTLYPYFLALQFNWKNKKNIVKCFN